MFVIDHSSLAMFKDCPRKYYYGILQGYRPTSVAAPLEFGKIYHDLLEYYDKQIVLGTDPDVALRLAVRKGIDASKGPGFSLDTRRTTLTLLRSLIWYVENYQNDPMKTHILPNGKPALELSFRVELPFSFSQSDYPVIYCGHIDKVVEFQGQLLAMERKHTTSAFYESYWDRYTFGSQISGYVMALQTGFNLDVGGAVIDATQIGVNFTRFGRRVAHRVNAHQQEWILDTSYWLSQVDLCLTSDRWPHNHEACGKYGGCQFRNVCFANPSVREVVLKSEYRVDKWDPLKPRGDDE